MVPQRVELKEINVLPEHRLVIVGPIDIDIPDATHVELDVGGVLVVQDFLELVIPNLPDEPCPARSV